MPEVEPDAISSEDVIATLQRSHGQLAGLLGPLDAEQVSGPSYDDDWTIAQVASHLGSGSEIFELYLDAGLAGTPTPGMDHFQPIWDVWNAKSPAQQAEDAVTASAQFLARVDALTDQQRADWTMELFGSPQTLATFLRMRAGEHAVHTWDIAVALDPTVPVADDAVHLIIDTLSSMVGYVGKPAEETQTVRIRTTGPERAFVLELTSEAASLTTESLDGGDGSAAAQLDLPAEALVRLVYGRLDPDHTPDSVHAHGVDLDVLRRSFPGF